MSIYKVQDWHYDFLLSKYQLWAEDIYRELWPRADIYQAKSQKAKRGGIGQESQENLHFFCSDGSSNNG